MSDSPEMNEEDMWILAVRYSLLPAVRAAIDRLGVADGARIAAIAFTQAVNMEIENRSVRQSNKPARNSRLTY
jgi:hypothetical protein